jgi:hypothetical protein
MVPARWPAISAGVRINCSAGGMMGNQLEDVVKKLESQLPELKRAIEQAAESWLARELGIDGDIRTLGNALADKVSHFIQDLVKLVKVVRHKDDLKGHSKSWESVDTQAIGLSDDLGNHEKGIRAQGYFDGIAGKAYATAVGKQSDAVKGMSEGAQAIQGALNTVASALDAADNAAATAGVSAGIAIAGVIVAIGSIETILGAIAGALTAVGGAWEFVREIQETISSLSNAQSDQAKAIQNLMKKQGDWPDPYTSDFAPVGDWKPL